MESKFKYITLNADAVFFGHSRYNLGEGHHHEIIECQDAEGYDYIGWIPTAFGFGKTGAITEVELIFKKRDTNE